MLTELSKMPLPEEMWWISLLLGYACFKISAIIALHFSTKDVSLYDCILIPLPILGEINLLYSLFNDKRFALLVSKTPKSTSTYLYLFFYGLSAAFMILALLIRVDQGKLNPWWFLLAFVSVCLTPTTLNFWSVIRRARKKLKIGNKVKDKKMEADSVYQELTDPFIKVFTTFACQAVLYFYLIWAVENYLQQLYENTNKRMDLLSLIRYILGFVIGYTKYMGNNKKDHNVLAPCLVDWKPILEKILGKKPFDVIQVVGWFGTEKEYLQQDADKKLLRRDIYVMDIMSRMCMDFVVNDFGLFAIVYSLPLLLSQTNEIHEFAFNLAGTDIIFQLDDLQRTRSISAHGDFLRSSNDPEEA